MEEKSFTITELVNNLIGDVRFRGDSHYDQISLNNLDNLEVVVLELIDTLCALSQLKDDYRDSGQSLAKKAFNIFDKVLESICDMIEETEYYKITYRE